MTPCSAGGSAVRIVPCAVHVTAGKTGVSCRKRRFVFVSKIGYFCGMSYPSAAHCMTSSFMILNPALKGGVTSNIVFQTSFAPALKGGVTIDIVFQTNFVFVFI